MGDIIKDHNIIDVINSLGESSKLYSIGKVEPSKIEEASKMLDVDFAEEFTEYTQEYGAISVAGIELCGVVNSKNLSTSQNTHNLISQKFHPQALIFYREFISFVMASI